MRCLAFRAVTIILLFAPAIAAANPEKGVASVGKVNGQEIVLDAIVASVDDKPITLSFQEPGGRTIVSYRSDDKDAPHHKRPGTKAGLNRFVWDLKHGGPTKLDPSLVVRKYKPFADEGGDPSGPVVKPGSYRVTLEIDGQSQAADFAVVKDPRVKTSRKAFDEQFALLEAAFPGRIDLGIGRAPGTDPVTSWALRHGAGGVSDEAVTHFPEYVDNVLAMMEPAGVGLALRGSQHVLKATPAAQSVPQIWLLGSSDYSARLAAAKGMPYVFAHHFSGSGTAEALELYRSTFQPSPELAEPRTFLTVNASVADTAQEAQRLALPQLLQMLALRTGQPLVAQRSVEDAETIVEAGLPEAHESLVEAMRRRWVIGDAAGARAELADLAASYGVDEVMVNPVGGAFRGTDPDRKSTRLNSSHTDISRMPSSA